MAIPLFTGRGELPLGVHAASLDEAIARSGGSSPQRRHVTENLKRIHALANGTGKLLRFVIFGSYVTAKVDPKDVDVVLVMADDFDESLCDQVTRRIFNHQHAEEDFGASVFWSMPCGIIGETVDEFIAHWQTKPHLAQRGIVEVVS